MPILSNISKSDMEKMILTGILGFIIIFVIIQFMMVPSLGKLNNLKKEIIKEQETLKRDQALVASKAQLQSRLASVQEKLKDYEKALPPYREMPNILQKIGEEAYGCKVKVTKIEPLRTEKPAAAAKPGAKPETANKPAAIYTEIPIQVEANGGYHALGEFINRIETSGNVMSIGDIEIKANPDDMLNHHARLLIVAYVLREEIPSK